MSFRNASARLGLICGVGLTSLCLALAPSIQAQVPHEVDLDIVSPIDNSSDNTHVFLSFVSKNTQYASDPSRSEIFVAVSDGTFTLDMATSPDFCSPDSTGLPNGTYAETCGCYFNLTQVDTNRSEMDVIVEYRNMDGPGQSLSGTAHRVFTPRSGPVRPPATGPICPAPTRTSDLAPVVMAGPDLTQSGAGMLQLDASASFDPEGTPLIFSWQQVSGPPVALTGANTAIPSFGMTTVTSPTELVFRVVASDKSGGIGTRSTDDHVRVTWTPGPQAASCSPWSRDRLIASLSAEQPNGPGTNYSLKHFITGQASTDMQAEADRLALIYPDFDALEIKSYVSPAGDGTLPVNQGGNVPGAPDGVRHWKTPLSPPPFLYWMGEPFSEGQWYRIDTKLNVRDAGGDLIPMTATYPDSCLYETIYLKYGTPGGLTTGRLSGPPRLTFSDGQSILQQDTTRPVVATGRVPVRTGRSQGRRPLLPRSDNVIDDDVVGQVDQALEETDTVDRKKKRRRPLFRRKKED